MDRFDVYNVPISVTDASSMLRTKIQPNMRPYTLQVVKLNNRLVDDWEEKVLKKMADRRGTVPSGKVWPSWKLYFEGKGILEYVKIRNMIPRVTKDQLKFWTEFFHHSTLEEIHSCGVGVVSFGWDIIETELRSWNADQKWEKIFSKSEDPLEWEKMAPSHQSLLKGELFPFWNQEILKTISEKVGTILHLQITPENFRQKITSNMKPYTQKVAKLNNDLVSEWEKEVLGKVTKRDTLEASEIPLWSLWHEGKGILEFAKIRDQLPSPTPHQIDFWKTVLENESIEDLHKRGSGVIHSAYRIIQNHIRVFIANKKLETIFQPGTNFDSWKKIASDHEELMQGKVLPFWDETTLSEVVQKIGTILSTPVTVEN